MLQRHATDVVSLFFGVVFGGFTIVWLMSVTDLIDLEQAWIAGPVILIAAGAVGLVAALRPSRASEPSDDPDASVPRG